jgi:hypothetical protein
MLIALSGLHNGQPWPNRDEAGALTGTGAAAFASTGRERLPDEAVDVQATSTGMTDESIDDVARAAEDP